MPGFQGWKPVLVMSRIASEDLTEGYLVKLSADNTVELCDTQGEAADGVVMETTLSGEIAPIMVEGYGQFIVTTASGFALGNKFTTSATTDDGKIEVAASGDHVLGRIDDAPAADDDAVCGFINCINPPVLA